MTAKFDAYPDLILPFVHSNGTSRQALLDQLCEVAHALRAVEQALGSAAPNMRDYYPVPDRWGQATRQHFRRCDAIRDLLDELQEEARLIYEGNDR